MAMLAEPRQKKRYNLVPRGKPLYEADDNRFGKKMMEKMGWSKDKGLGAREDGSREFVRVRYKHDVNGLGFEDRDDQWTQHEQQFNGLLKSLNNSENNSEEDESNETSFQSVGFGFKSEKNAADSIKNKISGESLEEKSKSSKARVHYQKFTRGKDLTKCSEKDLANIFGKKVVSEVETSKLAYGVHPFEGKNETNSSDSGGEQPKILGITTINTSVTIGDYFKNKMSKLGKSDNVKNDDGKKKKKKKDTEGSDDATSYQNDNYEIEPKKSNSKASTTGTIPEDIVQETKKKSKRKVNNEDETDVPKKKRKKKNIEDDSIATQNEDVNFDNTSNCTNTNIVESKTKVKDKKAKLTETINATESTEINDISTTMAPSDTNKVKKKKKLSKKADKLTNTNETANTINNFDAIEHADDAFSEMALKKKKKKKETSHETNIECTSLGKDTTQKKKRKANSSDEALDSTIKIDEHETVKVGTSDFNQKKKKSKKQEPHSEESNLTLLSELDVVGSIVTDTNDDVDQTLSWTTVTKKKKSKTSSEEQSVLQIEQPIEQQNVEQLENNCPNDEKKEHEIAQNSCPKYDYLEMNRDRSTLYISAVTAEKFRTVALDMFKGSTISDIVGYSMPDDIQLKVKKEDPKQITRIYAPDKNTQSNQYFKKAMAARKANKPLPKFNVRSMKRRKVFQGI